MRPSTRGLSPQPHSGRHASGPARDFTSLAPTSRAFTPALRFERVVLLVLKFSVHFAVGEEYREVPLVMTSATDAGGSARVVVELQHEGLRVNARRSRRR